MDFRIQKRKFSSNVIEASKDKDKWFVYLIPAVKKTEGDPLCEALLRALRPKLSRWQRFRNFYMGREMQ